MRTRSEPLLQPEKLGNIETFIHVINAEFRGGTESYQSDLQRQSTGRVTSHLGENDGPRGKNQFYPRTWIN